jgi:hypothetical protein
MAKTLGINVAKNGAPCECGRLKCATKYQEKCWCNRTTSFAPFTSYCVLESLHESVGEIDPCDCIHNTSLFLTYELAQKARVLNHTRPKGFKGSNFR